MPLLVATTVHFNADCSAAKKEYELPTSNHIGLISQGRRVTFLGVRGKSTIQCEIRIVSDQYFVARPGLYPAVCFRGGV